MLLIIQYITFAVIASDVVGYVIRNFKLKKATEIIGFLIGSGIRIYALYLLASTMNF